MTSTMHTQYWDSTSKATVQSQCSARAVQAQCVCRPFCTEQAPDGQTWPLFGRCWTDFDELRAKFRPQAAKLYHILAESGPTSTSFGTTSARIGLIRPSLAWLGRSNVEVEQMALDLVQALENHGLALQPAKCAWSATMHNPADDALQVIQGESIPRAGQMLVLGTAVDDGRDPVGVAVAHRTQRAWAAWCAMRPLLTLRSTAVRHRIRLFRTVVTATVMWRFECVPTRQSDRQRLDSIAITILP